MNDMLRLLLLLILTFLFDGFATAEPLTHNSAPIANQWPTIHAAYFNQQKVEEDHEAIQLEAPSHAENPAIIPFAWRVQLENDTIEELSIFSDGNPIVHTATFKLNVPSSQFSGNTRLRLDQNSLVRVVIKTTKNRFLMKAIVIKTPGGGCGGAAMTDEATLRETAGRVKIKLQPNTKGNSAQLNIHLKHPMRTGFERTFQGYYSKAWFMATMQLAVDEKSILEIILQPGLSADPYFSLELPWSDLKSLNLRMTDNEGKEFNQAVPLTHAP